MLELNLKSQLGDWQWDVNENLSPGVCHWVTGPNGCGKTTFFEQLKVCWSSPLALAFMDQAPLDSYQALTVGQLFDVLVDAAVDRVISRNWRELPIWDERSRKLWHKNITQLSGGEMQWIKFLMMRTLNAKVWILDEPFHGLDQSRQLELTQLLQNWLKEGCYLIMAHHGEMPIAPFKPWRLATDMPHRLEAI